MKTLSEIIDKYDSMFHWTDRDDEVLIQHIEYLDGFITGLTIDNKFNKNKLQNAIKSLYKACTFINYINNVEEN